MEVPHPFSSHFFKETYKAFDAFIDREDGPERIERDGREWIALADNRVRYSGYFKPYYRVSHGGPYKDFKYVLQVTEEYLNFLSRAHKSSELALIDPYARCLLGSARYIFAPLAIILDGCDQSYSSGSGSRLDKPLSRYGSSAMKAMPLPALISMSTKQPCRALYMPAIGV
jgi:hypothetical protein